MNTIRKTLLTAAVTMSCTAMTVNAQEAGSVAEALKAGTTKLHFRPRYESVEQEGLEDATALTLKTRLTYTSGTYQGFGLTLEMDDTTAFFDDDYNGPGQALIADPEVTEVNQSYISYTTGGFTGKYGRQRIILDNQRFVGGVGWRQDEQTFDALSTTYAPNDKLNLFAAYVTQVNRIFGETQDHNHESVLLNASYNFGFVKLIGYGYLLENKTLLTLSSDTVGVRGQFKFNDVFGANLEFASQSEAGDNPTEYSADYTLVEGLAGIPIGDSKLNVKVGYEVLGSDDGEAAFLTPLATLHAFQGWTDLFLGTPAAGIEDTYVSAGTAFGPVNVSVLYHSLSADEGDFDYGSEIGFVVGSKVGVVDLTLKYADYSSDMDFDTTFAPSKDTTKLWLMAAMTF